MDIANYRVTAHYDDTTPLDRLQYALEKDIREAPNATLSINEGTISVTFTATPKGRHIAGMMSVTMLNTKGITNIIETYMH